MTSRSCPASSSGAGWARLQSISSGDGERTLSRESACASRIGEGDALVRGWRQPSAGSNPMGASRSTAHDYGMSSYVCSRSAET